MPERISVSPIVASLYALGYEQVSEYKDVIYFKKGEQVLTVDLNTLSLTCLQLQDNCIAPDSSNAHYTCIRKGQDIYVDSETFADALKLIGCNYIGYGRLMLRLIMTHQPYMCSPAILGDKHAGLSQNP